MTDSSSRDKTGSGVDPRLDLQPSIEQLFGEVESASFEADTPIHAAEFDTGGAEEEAIEDTDQRDDSSSSIEDRTAAEVFDHLRDEVTSDRSDDELTENSPEEIIAWAEGDLPSDFDDPHVDDTDYGLVVDEAALDELLLSGRVAGEEFLWIDDEEADETDDTADEETAEGASDESSPTPPATSPDTLDTEDRPTSPIGGVQVGPFEEWGLAQEDEEAASESIDHNGVENLEEDEAVATFQGSESTPNSTTDAEDVESLPIAAGETALSAIEHEEDDSEEQPGFVGRLKRFVSRLFT